MSAADGLKQKLLLTRASVQTDSLTVALDLTVASKEVEAHCLYALGATGKSGQELQPRSLPEFMNICRTAYEVLARDDKSEALHFATVISAVIHECRHVHDLRTTRIGAELLIGDVPTYARLPILIEDLAHWQRLNHEARLPLPLKTVDFDALNIPSRARDVYAYAVQNGTLIDRRWKSKSCFKTLPGFSIKDLFEALGFETQVDFLAGTYGNEIAEIVVEACLGGELTRTKYLRPQMYLAQRCEEAGVRFDPDLGDLSHLTLAALNMSSLDDAFQDSRPGERHPGAWFERVAEVYARLAHDERCPAQERAVWPASIVAQSVLSTSMKDLYQQASDALDIAQRTLLESIGPRFTRAKISHAQISPAALIATEIAVDFRQGQRTLVENPEYHSPIGYLELLMGGGLTRIYVRANTRSFGVIDFRTPSEIPSNHVGGARVASSASQQIRFLMTGPRFDGGFLQAQAFQELSDPAGPNLRFRGRRA